MCEHGFATFVLWDLLRSVEICWDLRRSFAACSRNSVRSISPSSSMAWETRKQTGNPWVRRRNLRPFHHPAAAWISGNLKSMRIYENLRGGWQKHVMPGSWINKKNKCTALWKAVNHSLPTSKINSLPTPTHSQHQELTPNTKHWLTSNTKNTFRRRGRVGFPFPHWCWGVTSGTPS